MFIIYSQKHFKIVLVYIINSDGFRDEIRNYEVNLSIPANKSRPRAITSKILEQYGNNLLEGIQINVTNIKAKKYGVLRTFKSTGRRQLKFCKQKNSV